MAERDEDAPAADTSTDVSGEPQAASDALRPAPEDAPVAPEAPVEVQAPVDDELGAYASGADSSAVDTSDLEASDAEPSVPEVSDAQATDLPAGEVGVSGSAGSAAVPAEDGTRLGVGDEAAREVPDPSDRPPANAPGSTPATSVPDVSPADVSPANGSPADGSPSGSSPADGPSASTTPPPNGWRVLGDSLRPRATRAQLLAGVLCALLGFAVVVQVRQNDESALAGLRQSELVRILDETTERGDQLRQEVSDLRGERDELLSGSDRQQAALDSLRRSAVTQGILSGRLPAEGPGVEVLLLDPEGGLQPSTMLNMLEELRNAGAEAIQLNGQRITASSSFTGTRGNVVLDGVDLAPPFTWLAIGDPETLAIALQIPGGAMATVRGTGATGEVAEKELVEVTALRDLPDPSYATPVPPEAG